MRTEKILWWFAIACALVLLTGLFPGWRTMWFRGGNSIRDSAGWDWLAALSGLIAIVALGIGAWARPRVVVPVFGAAAAAVAFAVTAYAAGNYWLAILTETVTLEGTTVDDRWAIYPSAAVPFFTITATAATGFALVLAVAWLRPGEIES